MQMRGAGRYLLAWRGVLIDGSHADPNEPLLPGAVWQWSGQAMRLDGAQGALLLEGALGRESVRSRAMHAIQKMSRTQGIQLSSEESKLLPLLSGSITVGHNGQFYRITPIQGERATFWLCNDGLPPRGKLLTIVDAEPRPKITETQAQKTICFTPGTLIRTKSGPTPVEALIPGDLIQTKDNGLQPLIWIGQRHVSAARLYVDRALRPIRIRAGALGAQEPQPDLIVSPDHQLLLHKQAAKALFNTSEVLVRAQDLVDDYKIRPINAPSGVIYLHLLFDQHQIIWANGVETESLHPEDADLAHLSTYDREDLRDLCGAENSFSDYGPTARRSLSKAEAALLLSEAGARYFH